MTLIATTNIEMYLCSSVKVINFKAQSRGITAAVPTPRVPPMKEKYMFTFSNSRAIVREDPASQMFIFL